jgi:flagellar basal-body rod protein FlgC
MNLLDSMKVAASGLSAQRTRMQVASSNLANASTTRTPDGGPYQKRGVAFESVETDDGIGMVEVAEIREDGRPPRLEYDPGHPDADAAGYVALPNVSVVEEMVDMITASRAYEAGLTSLETTVSLAERALEIGR